MGKAHKILLVDDALDALVALERLLKRRGYEVTSVTTAEDALKVLAQHPVHLLITDWRLPGIDGLTLALQAQTYNPQIKVLILTAYEDAYDKARAGHAAKVDAYLTKPFDPLQLLALVTNLLDCRRSS
ncbi:MAG: response regulator [Abditibacteriales bacterium]|nr:response regulator [Abditibacteriales bacterium]MDW8367801.1 response regulator [Abditibacteriales bacterium]